VSRELAGALRVRADESGFLARLSSGDDWDARCLRAVTTVELAEEAAATLVDAERDAERLAQIEGVLL
jgi:hypothetical protein